MGINAAKIKALPQYSTIELKAGTYSILKLPSVRAAHDIAKTLARTAESRPWISDPDWVGLAPKQTVAQWDATGIAEVPLALLKSSEAQLDKQHTKFAQPRASVTGGYWDTPSVLAGLPLAARTRKRTALKPVNLKFSFCLSGGIRAEAMAKITSRIARAVWEYTMAGGAVTLHVAHVANYMRGPNRDGTRGLIIDFKVNPSDQSALAQCLTPALGRAATFPLMAELSDQRGDLLYPPIESILPGYVYLGGVLTQALKNAEDAIKALKIE